MQNIHKTFIASNKYLFLSPSQEGLEHLKNLVLSLPHLLDNLSSSALWRYLLTLLNFTRKKIKPVEELIGICVILSTKSYKAHLISFVAVKEATHKANAQGSLLNMLTN